MCARRVVRLLESALYNSQNSLDLRLLLMMSILMIMLVPILMLMGPEGRMGDVRAIFEMCFPKVSAFKHPEERLSTKK